MNGFEQLERELLAAERRLAGAAAATRQLRTPWWRRIAGQAATAIAVIVALVIAAGAIVLADHRASSKRAAHPELTAVQRLVDELGVLRSPPTAAARRWLHGKDFRRLTHTPGRFQLIPSLARALSLPDHERLILYMVRTSRSRLTGLGVMEQGRTSGFGECCTTAQQLSRPTGPGPLHYQSGRIPPQVYFEIVPDGVSKVRWTFARRGNFGHVHLPPRIARRRPPTPASFIGAPHSAPLTVTVAVHDNVAAMKLPNRGAALSDTWLDAVGRVIAHHGKA